ncbi:MAG: hypothetical protein LQ346_006481 [Caloplaca aetnensis]|nr:MAG: hypothetical protein LQ346_006481 [Caloplaca aetnensis]
MDSNPASSISENTLDMARLAEQVQRLPQELKDQIENLVYEMGLRPSFLYPPATAMYEAGPKRGPAPNMRLLTVDKHVNAKYGERFWSESTLVLDAVKPTFLKALTDNATALKSIRRVHLSFTTKDLGYTPKEQPEFSDRHPLAIAHHYQFNCALRMRWLVNAFYVNKLAPSLEALTLDFTDCYLPSRTGIYWEGGLAMAMWLEPTLLIEWTLGTVAKLQICAPDEAKERGILNALRTHVNFFPLPPGSWGPKSWMMKDEPILPSCPTR